MKAEQIAENGVKNKMVSGTVFGKYADVKMVSEKWCQVKKVSGTDLTSSDGRGFFVDKMVSGTVWGKRGNGVKKGVRHCLKAPAKMVSGTVLRH